MRRLLLSLIYVIPPTGSALRFLLFIGVICGVAAAQAVTDGLYRVAKEEVRSGKSTWTVVYSGHPKLKYILQFSSECDPKDREEYDCDQPLVVGQTFGNYYIPSTGEAKGTRVDVASAEFLHEPWGLFSIIEVKGEGGHRSVTHFYKILRVEAEEDSSARAATQSASSPKKDIPAIARAASGSIVSIVMSDKDGKPVAQGSGFFVSKDGLIVTNYHVISEGSSAVVKLPDGAFYVVDGVLTFDKARDIAVIKAHGKNFQTLALGNSDRIQVGEQVVAIGTPLSLEATVSNGIVSAIREVEGGKFLQVTAPISPGSSGGPLFNMAGQVVGITTMYLKGGENLNFAIPINDVKPLLEVNSSKLQGFPDEPESTKTKRQSRLGDTSPTAPVAGNISAARGYYQQLYDAGGFAPGSFATASDGSKISIGRMPIADYACFSDDTRSDTFFTFTAYAYDKDWSEAVDKQMRLPVTADSAEEYRRLERIQQVIQDTAPYVRFMFREVFEAYPLDAQKFLRSGGRFLVEDVYVRGVKTNTIEYNWDGRSWFLPITPADPNAYTRSSKVLRLSIEATTMRYVESATVTITVGRGETAATDTTSYGPWGGVCERIPTPKGLVGAHEP